ncbi:MULTISPECIES: hypothetical protein [Streptomyces]|uniref:hypothetical protein n=1 Tax=Streptomyces TaxID=1883 RepID=UPI0036C65F52
MFRSSSPRASGPTWPGALRRRLLGFWNNGTTLTALLYLDIGRSGTNRKLAPDS